MDVIADKQLSDEVETLLNSNDSVESVNRIDEHFELFMKDESHPITVSVGRDSSKDFEGKTRFSAMMQFKVLPNSDHHWSINILTGYTAEELVREMISNYHKNMKGSIDKVKQGFKKDTGIDADDALTTNQ